MLSRQRHVISCIGNNMDLEVWQNWIQISKLTFHCCVTQWKNCLYETRIVLFEIALHTQAHTCTHNTCTNHMISLEHVHVHDLSFYFFQYFHFSQHGFIVLIVQILHIFCSVYYHFVFWCYYKCYFKISIVRLNIPTKRWILSN